MIIEHTLIFAPTALWELFFARLKNCDHIKTYNLTFTSADGLIAYVMTTVQEKLR